MGRSIIIYARDGHAEAVRWLEDRPGARLVALETPRPDPPLPALFEAAEEILLDRLDDLDRMAGAASEGWLAPGDAADGILRAFASAACADLKYVALALLKSAALIDTLPPDPPDGFMVATGRPEVWAAIAAARPPPRPGRSSLPPRRSSLPRPPLAPAASPPPHWDPGVGAYFSGSYWPWREEWLAESLREAGGQVASLPSFRLAPTFQEEATFLARLAGALPRSLRYLRALGWTRAGRVDVTAAFLRAVLRKAITHLPLVASRKRWVAWSRRAGPRLHVVGDYLGFEGRWLIGCLREAGWRTVMYDHAIYGNYPHYSPIEVDTILTWGEASREWYLTRGYAPEQIRVVGAPAYARLLERAKVKERTDIARLIGASPDARWLYIAHTCGSRYTARQGAVWMDRILFDLCAAVETLPGWQAIVKFHPSADDPVMEGAGAIESKRAWLRRVAPSAALVPDDAEAEIHFAFCLQAEVVAFYYGTAGLDAAMADRPLLIYDPIPLPPWVGAYAETGAALTVRKAAEIGPALRAIEGDPVIRARLAAGRTRLRDLFVERDVNPADALEHLFRPRRPL